jgi:hypothetical protein
MSDLRMRIASKPLFLVLRTEPTSSSTEILIANGLSEVVANWTSSTRVSPIWALGQRKTAPSTFDGKQRLLFLGPVSPARLFKEVDVGDEQKGVAIWTSLGTFNLIVRANADSQSSRMLDRIAKWAAASNVASETWRLENGHIQTWVASPLHSRTGMARAALAKLARQKFGSSLKIHAEEFLVLMSSSLARSALVANGVCSDLEKVALATVADIGDALKNPAEILDVTAELISMNAALSRFSSQAFSGISPITSTECHFWIHSLLGTGLANFALANLVEFICIRLGRAKLPERFVALKAVTHEVPSYEDLLTKIEIVQKDHLGQIKLDRRDELQDIQPIVTYFSGRDGYSSQLQTLSAPLTSITQANSFQTNILTVTHEISHVFVEGVLGYLYPDPDDAAEIVELTDFITSEREPRTMFEAARRLLVEAVIGMEQLHQGRTIDNNVISTSDMLEMLTRWRREAKEVMVHTFDFLYFFKDEPDRYVETIWSTWCAIPGISERIPEYIVRTLCAISPRLLDLKPAARREAVRSAFVSALENLKNDETITTDYAQKALSHVASYWDAGSNGLPSISRRYEVWLYLVRLVSAFLFSPKIAADLFSDQHVVSESRKRRGMFDDAPIGNPISFIRNHLSKSPSEAESLWLLHNIALCLRA